MSPTIPNYDATFCGRLPLHQTNLVQSHGVLFVLDPESFEVLQVSETVSEALPGISAADLAGKPFSQFLDPASFQELQQAPAKREKRTVNLTLIGGEQKITCSASVQQHGGFLFVEIILPKYAPNSGRSFLAVYQEIKTLMTEIGRQTDLESFAHALARELRQISGFDKVLVYSFNEEWHGTVIAEEKVPEMATYFGLRFPASDIPKPARDLYLKNPYRLIPNRSAPSAKLYPLLNPQTNAYTDLSACDLRSVAGVHLEYMKNMGITASLSLRLVHEGKLWGLISCHHRSPRYFSFEELGLFELLSNIVSAQLSILLNQNAVHRRQVLQEKLTALVPRLHEGNSLHTTLGNQAGAVLDLLCANGMAFNFNGHIETYGTVPEENDLHRLFYWLQVQNPSGLVHLPSLPRVFEEASVFASIGSGILALPVVPQKGAFLVAFRPETVEEVAWGGNPHEALQLEGDGKTYHPRHSFQVWKQTVRHTAKNWSQAELGIADALKNVLTSIMLHRLHS